MQLRACHASYSAMHCFLAPLRQPAADDIPEAPSSTHQGRGRRSCSTSHQQTSVPLPLYSRKQLTTSIEHKLNIPSQLTLCKSGSSATSWNGPQVDCEVPKSSHTQTPDRART
eukprot:1156802-Pelagomonas_calceolata.AAC.5